MLNFFTAMTTLVIMLICLPSKSFANGSEFYDPCVASELNLNRFFIRTGEHLDKGSEAHPDSDGCFISIQLRTEYRSLDTKQTYLSYAFNSHGKWLITRTNPSLDLTVDLKPSETGTELSSDKKILYFLPTLNPLGYRFDDSFLIINTVNGEELTFNTNSGLFTQISNAEISHKENNWPFFNSQIKIKNPNFYLFEWPSHKAENSFGFYAASVRFHYKDINCVGINQNIFNYDGSPLGPRSLRKFSLKELKEMVADVCSLDEQVTVSSDATGL